MGNALLHLLTGDEFGSAEALRLNFVQRVVPAGQQLNEALHIAQAIAAQAPLAVVATRQNVLKALEQGPLVAMHEFISVQKTLANSEDAKEGVQSFIEKRAARFTGK
jgi:enoyl-CoA hydratase/carnithine racemase